MVKKTYLMVMRTHLVPLTVNGNGNWQLGSGNTTDGNGNWQQVVTTQLKVMATGTTVVATQPMVMALTSE